MSIEKLVFTDAWSSAGGTNTFPAVVVSEAEARENLDSQHIATKTKVNEIVDAVNAIETEIEGLPQPLQSDWEEDDVTSLAYIVNKPTIPPEITVDAALDEDSTNPVQNKAIFAALLSMIYPVGSIYMSVNSTSPATFLGGTWVQIKDRFLLAAGDNYSPGATGGAATQTLDLANYQKDTWLYKDSGADTSVYPRAERIGYAQNYYGYLTEEANEAFSIMPPYLAVYVWKRTA